ncbi:camp-dependent protein kinase regulatory subunit [Saitoella complicata NRRL Y-17804]|uniref:camp-dependent protein kinase regulatory subunit n=1 Tax=Saitoella complicata (strain BCRC 22490 / CBS 7301 / JCM 7358 / NBRC 10748 / NRRL Y-17804) TaxID=698492 RepID=UPI00086752BA|nr:camp-dependent protein kinase regulatory subunit [Saitoella complicata NRRL Y-17804]ODQ50330.1 camp-dependent protein kinase regulatory subunit [Saitoella complicata NRRL Y-17804]
MTIPTEYANILNELNREVLRSQPADVLQFCSDFFLRKLGQQRKDMLSAMQREVGHTSTGAPTTTTTTTTTATSSTATFPPSATMQQRPHDDQSGHSTFPGTSFPGHASSGPSDHQSYPAGYNLNRRTSVSAESMVPQADDSPLPHIPKSQQQLQRIDASISQNLLFKNLDEDQHRDVLNAMSEVRVERSGSVVIKQGDIGDFFYVVERGEFDVFITQPNTHPTDPLGKKVATIGAGGSFGELALMYNAPRAASVVSSSPDSILWALDRITFRRILMENTYRKRIMYESFLSTIAILRPLSSYDRQRIADALDTVTYEPRSTIIRQGDVGEHFYLIESGTCDVVIDGEGTVAQLGKGDFFGELALLNDKPRAATVVSTSRVKVATLGKRAFVRLLGPLADKLSDRCNDRPILRNLNVAPTNPSTGVGKVQGIDEPANIPF